MENRVTNKNVGRRPLATLYSANSNLSSAPVGKNNTVRSSRNITEDKSTFIFCDSQDENAIVNVGHGASEKQRPLFFCGENAKEEKAKLDPGDENRKIDVSICEEGENSDGKGWPSASEKSFPKGILSSANYGFDTSSVDMESVLGEQTKCSFMICDDQTEKNVSSSYGTMSECKSKASVLCVSMKSATTTSDWASELVEKQARRDVIVSCLEYADEIQSYLRSMETKYRPKPYYMRKQPEVGTEMRTILVDWLVDVANEYDLSQETLHLAVQYTDRFLSIMAVRKEHFQLLGIAAMMIAAKYEEIYPPELNAFIYITDDTYSKREMRQMEQIILKTLDFNLSAPTAYIFLIYYLNKSHAGQRCQNLAKYLCDLALMDYSFLSYLPSMIAASSTFLAHYVTDGIIQADSVQRACGYSVAEIYPCAQHLLLVLKCAGEHPHQALRDKYKDDKYCRVALLEPPDTLPLSESCP